MPKLLVVIGITGQQVRTSTTYSPQNPTCSTENQPGRLRRQPLRQRARLESPRHIARPIQSPVLDRQRRRSSQSRPQRTRISQSSLQRRQCHLLQHRFLGPILQPCDPRKAQARTIDQRILLRSRSAAGQECRRCGRYCGGTRSLHHLGFVQCQQVEQGEVHGGLPS